jgi:PKD repeat protein
VADQWYWSFGDGGSGTAKDPIYTYTQPGLFTITQRVTDTAKWDMLTRTDTFPWRRCDRLSV